MGSILEILAQIYTLFIHRFFIVTVFTIGSSSFNLGEVIVGGTIVSLILRFLVGALWESLFGGSN